MIALKSKLRFLFGCFCLGWAAQVGRIDSGSHTVHVHRQPAVDRLQVVNDRL